MSGQSKNLAVLYTIASSLVYAVYPVFAKIILGSIGIETMNILLPLFASIIYFIIFLFSGGLMHYRIIVQNYKKIGLISLVTAVAALLYAEGILTAGPTNAVFIMQFAVVFNVLFGAFVLKEKFTKFETLGIIIAVAGIFTLAYSEVTIEFMGTLILLVAAFLIAVTGLLSKVYLRKINPLTLAGGTPIFVLIFISIYSFPLGKVDMVISPYIILLAVIATLTGLVVNYILLYKALQIFDLSKVTTLGTIGPFITAVLSFFVLSQIPTVQQLLGGAIIIAGILMLIFTKK